MAMNSSPVEVSLGRRLAALGRFVRGIALAWLAAVVHVARRLRTPLARSAAPLLSMLTRAEDRLVALLVAIGGAVLTGLGQLVATVAGRLVPLGRVTVAVLARAQTLLATRLDTVARASTARLRGQQERAAAPAAPLADALPPPGVVVDERLDAGALLFRASGVAGAALAATSVVALTAALVIGPVTANAAGALNVALQLPDEAGLAPLDERSVILAADGSVLAVLDREVDRKVVALDTIPKHVQQAVVTAEDRKFWEHEGYDIEGIARAAVANARARGIEQGGSTITQQLAKAQVGTERSFDRKISELLYAMALEERFTKTELLEQYLNQVYFGANSYGIAAAAEEFFGKAYQDLTVDQAALLAGLIRSPNSADPRQRPQVALGRRNAILADMGAEGYLDPADVPGLQARPLGVRPPHRRKEVAPHVVDSVEREFLTSPAYAAFGKTADERRELLYHGGLRIHTTLDPRLQRAAEEVVYEAHPPGSRPAAAIVAVEPGTGRVRAAFSGVRYSDEQYDLATQGRRQPGSAFKPFVYAAALEQGFPLSTSLDGSSPTYFEGICGWAREDPRGCESKPETRGVENYEGSSYGRLDMATALRKSVNTAAAQLMVAVGPQAVADLASRMGVNMAAAARVGAQPVFNHGMALGGLSQGTTPLEMASAYAVFANDGRRVPAHFIERIEDAGGREVYRAESRAQRVLPAQVNAAMVDMMQDVVRRGTGTAARLAGWEPAGKTGTTQKNTDAWFVGYTPVLSTAVWVGHPEGQVPMGRATGGGLAAPLWRAFMTRALEGVEPVAFPEVALTGDRVAAGEPVEVPDVRGLTDAAALRALAALNLLPDARAVDSRAAAGTIIWQSPKAGTTAQSGDSVILGVSTGNAPKPKPKPKPQPAPAPDPAPEPAPAPEPDGDSGGPPDHAGPPGDQGPPGQSDGG